MLKLLWSFLLLSVYECTEFWYVNKSKFSSFKSHRKKGKWDKKKVFFGWGQHFCFPVVYISNFLQSVINISCLDQSNFIWTSCAANHIKSHLAAIHLQPTKHVFIKCSLKRKLYNASGLVIFFRKKVFCLFIYSLIWGTNFDYFHWNS